MLNYEVNVYFMVHIGDEENSGIAYGAFDNLKEAKKELVKEKKRCRKESWYNESDFYITKVVHYEEVVE